MIDEVVTNLNACRTPEQYERSLKTWEEKREQCKKLGWMFIDPKPTPPKGYTITTNGNNKRIWKPDKRMTWDIYERQKNKTGKNDKGYPICPLCDRPITFPDGEVDHIFPVSKCSEKEAMDKNSDVHQVDNLQFVHKECNRLKSDLSQIKAREKILKLKKGGN